MTQTRRPSIASNIPLSAKAALILWVPLIALAICLTLCIVAVRQSEVKTLRVLRSTSAIETCYQLLAIGEAYQAPDASNESTHQMATFESAMARLVASDEPEQPGRNAKAITQVREKFVRALNLASDPALHKQDIEKEWSDYKTSIQSIIDKELVLRQEYVSAIHKDSELAMLLAGVAFVIALVTASGATIVFEKKIAGVIGRISERLRSRVTLNDSTGKGSGSELSELDVLSAVMLADSGRLTSRLAEAEAENKENRERLRILLTAMPIGILVVGDGSIIKKHSPHAITILGCSQNELLGTKLEQIFYDDNHVQGDFDLLKSALDQLVEVNAKHGNGSDIAVEVIAKNIVIENSTETLVLFNDISARRELTRLRKEFVSMVSHDLKTPLTSIQVFHHLLSAKAEDKLDKSLKTGLNAARRSTERLLNLVNDLLDFERSEVGKLEMHPSNCSLEDIVSRSLESVSAFADEHHVKIDASEAMLDEEIRCDRDRMVQVLVNLLSNAVKFSPENGSVIVDAEFDEDGTVEISVKDKGRGIPKKFLDTVFERYKQVETTDRTQKKGTGLGLPICKAIVEAHGGTIGVESEEGSGSRFWFKIPLRFAEQSETVT